MYVGRGDMYHNSPIELIPDHRYRPHGFVALSRLCKRGNECILICLNRLQTQEFPLMIGRKKIHLSHDWVWSQWLWLVGGWVGVVCPPWHNHPLTPIAHQPIWSLACISVAVDYNLSPNLKSFNLLWFEGLPPHGGLFSKFNLFNLIGLLLWQLQSRNITVWSFGTIKK